MEKIIQANFTKQRSAERTFSIDMYTKDMRCERFNVSAICHKMAYQTVIGSPAFALETSGIRAIAIYANTLEQRENTQMPLLISHFKEPDQTTVKIL